MLNTGRICQLNTNRLGLILFKLAPTPRSSQHPRRNQSVTKVRVVTPVPYWTSLDCHFLGGEWGGCCKLSSQSCHWHSMDGSNVSCHRWVQAIKTWKPLLPCAQVQKHSWHDTTQKVDWGVLDKAQHQETQLCSAHHRWKRECISSLIIETCFWGSSECEQRRQDKNRLSAYLDWRSHTFMCSSMLSFTTTDVSWYFLYT